MSPGPIHVTADDRSGAMETAALLADSGMRVWVRSWDGDSVHDRLAECVVTDLRSRHLAPVVAAERAAALAATAAVSAHKMDSTLRGNWADEIGALRSGRGVLLVPAYPSAGRTCSNGIVRVQGVPVAQSEFASDRRNPVLSSRPAEAWRDTGEDAVFEASGADAVADWARAGAQGVCVADATTDDGVESCVAAVGTAADVLVVGTALTVASLWRSRERRPGSPALPPGDVLVVCGSLHPASRVQAALAAALPGVTVHYPPAHLRSDPEIVALEMAVRAHDHASAHRPALVVLLGGDTADAFIGECAVRVIGSLAPGLAIGELEIDATTITVLTKPGAFGHDHLLVDALARRPGA